MFELFLIFTEINSGGGQGFAATSVVLDFKEKQISFNCIVLPKVLFSRKAKPI